MFLVNKKSINGCFIVYSQKIVNRNTIGDLGVGDTAISRDFESIMYDFQIPIIYDEKFHSYVATDEFEIPWRVVNDEIGEILQDSKDILQSLINVDNSNQKLKHLLENISKIESINSEKIFLI